MDPDQLQCVIEHVFIPPRLPTVDNSSPTAPPDSKKAILQLILETFQTFHGQFSKEDAVSNGSTECLKMLTRSIRLRDDKYKLDVVALQDGISKMQSGDSSFLHLEAQNAGLIISRSASTFIFESFELSPTCTASMTCEGRLVRTFPGPNVAVPADDVMDPGFLDCLIDMLIRLDEETVEEVTPKANKGGNAYAEIREAPAPHLVTELLTGILRGISEGGASDTNTRRITKHTREDIIFEKKELLPWRRSPLYLLIRVAIQLKLEDSGSKDEGAVYKSFMLFFMASLLKKGLDTYPIFPMDMLFMMNRRVARKSFKLGDRCLGFASDLASDMISSASEHLRSVWSDLEAGSETSIDFSSIHPADDLKQSLKQPGFTHILRKFHVNGLPNIEAAKTFVPNAAHHVAQTSNAVPDADLLFKGDCTTALMDIETWVRDHLYDWKRREAIDPTLDHCLSLVNLLEAYQKRASRVYLDEPENQSVKFLTVFDLWCVFDELVTQRIELLKRYPFIFEPKMFEPLLLSKKSQHDQLARILLHFKCRSSCSSPQLPHIFQSAVTDDSFASKYFENSAEMSSTKTKILIDADANAERKRAELREKLKEREKLMAISDGYLTCERFTHWRGWSTHDRNCRKCRFRKEAEDVSIAPYELPLPADNIEANSVVFELCMPEEFKRWRDVTYSLLLDDCSTTGSNKAVSYRTTSAELAHVYEPLLPFRGTIGNSRRIALSSAAKPFAQSHYSRPSSVLSFTESDIIVPNALAYKYFDTKHETPLLPHELDLRPFCTPRLGSKSPYNSLQFAIRNTSHTSNEVLGKQGNCSLELTLHEFYSFGTLRSGHRLQLRNIARELKVQSINFSAGESHTLITQALWQLGPFMLEDTGTNPVLSPEKDRDLLDLQFCTEFLGAVEEIAMAVKDNWRSCATLRTCFMIINRIYSMSDNADIHSQCEELLGLLRWYVLLWSRELRKLHDSLGVQTDEKEDNSTKQEKSEELRGWLAETALTCIQSFDVEDSRVASIFDSGGGETLAIYLEALSIANDNLSQIKQAEDYALATLVKRHIRLVDRIAPKLLSIHSETLSSGLDLAIKNLWEQFVPAKDPVKLWSFFDGPNRFWAERQTSCEGGANELQVCFDVASGALLVNGAPLKSLPREYLEDKNYQRLFGGAALEVGPSKMQGMLFESKHMLGDRKSPHAVHFGMFQGSILIRSTKENMLYQYVPSFLLEVDFPRDLVEDFAHWIAYDMDTKVLTVEWRPLHDPWSDTPEWTLKGFSDSSPDDCVLVKKDGAFLVDWHSKTSERICKALAPIEDGKNLVIQFVEATGHKRLSVLLPRYKLEFFLQKCGSTKRLECRQYRNMVIDDNQSFGALTGLVNRLVLRNYKDQSRLVLIPHADIEFRLSGNYPEVRISSSDLGKYRRLVPYHAFRIDPVLQRLVGNRSIKSDYFKAYLHALTSSCLPDSLTGRTGTEEALVYLRSEPARSFQNLESDEADLLESIARLTPKRVYYPQHLAVMQSVDWLPLPPLSQNNAFFVEVSDIVSKAKQSALFLERNLPVALPGIPDPLLRRASFRDSIYYSEECRVDTTGIQDEVYHARDCVQNGSRELRVCEISQLTHSWEKHLKVSSRLDETLRTQISKFGGRSEDGVQWLQLLRYDPALLKNHLRFLGDNWANLQKTLATTTKYAHRYHVLFFLGTIAYSNEVDMELVRSMLALATDVSLRQIMPPKGEAFDLFDCDFDIKVLDVIFDSHKKDLATSSPQHPALNSWVRWTNGMAIIEYNERLQKAFEKKRDETYAIALAKLEALDWRQLIHVDSCIKTSYWKNLGLEYFLVHEEDASEECKAQLLVWKRNSDFRTYVQEIAEKLRLINPRELTFRPLHITNNINTSHQHRYNPTITLSDLFARPVKALELQIPPKLSMPVTLSPEADRTEGFLQSLRITGANGSHEDNYASDLLESFRALENGMVLSTSCSIDSIVLSEFKSNALEYKEHCAQFKQQLEDCIRKELQPKSVHEWILFGSGAWPHVTTNVLIRQLASAKFTQLPLIWKNKLVSYGKAVSELQRARRICNLLQAEDIDRVALFNELQNSGHTWEPMEHSDWLLLQIENDITIRQHQADIAMAMIQPKDNKNSVLQLNMGEGKSSVIVPMVASALADGSKLVRVVVLKPLARQMFQLLVQKLSGMLNRRIFYMPFSRSLKLDSAQKAQQILDLYKECKRVGGCLLIQPEHILSFELMGVERIAEAGEDLAAQKLIEAQKWLDANARDVLDESDEILSVKFELIYTIGTQRNVEFSPNRWKLIQDIMDVVKDAAVEVQETLGEDAIKVVWDERASYPRINLLQDDATDRLLEIVARRICTNGMKGVSVRSLDENTRYAVEQFLTVYDTDETSLGIIKARIHKSDTLWSSLLLLRGLIAGGVISFALKEKRWRVDYGLDPKRTLLAVPFRAKDCPATRAEFSNPDFTIFVTLLSFYNGGLTDDQLYACLQLLFSMDTADEEYALWAADSHATLPKQFQTRKGVNDKDHRQCVREIFPHFRRSKAVIDFFLSHNVFPREVREFPEKLSASGWNIAKTKKHPVTGFSGTNDSRYVLPLSISQNDLSTQLHTNAAVLHCLLREENSFEDLLVDNRRQEFSAELLLDKISKIKPPVKVLIDVGAQILELKNEQVAVEWLKRTKGPGCSAAAVVFFSDRDELLVLGRDGTKEPLQISPFANQLDECLVYLDEVHTRGTDLKLPLNYRAAVTLGPKLTKDRLAQACMRMRNLGKGQSVTFCAPEPIRREIIACAGKSISSSVEVMDVLRWSIKETCAHTRKSIPLWATQGERFYRQRKCWEELRGEKLGQALREKESKSLQEWYDAPRNKIANGSKQQFSVPEIVEKLSQFDIKDGQDTALQEEQERELSPENEREVQIERPPLTNGLRHKLDLIIVSAVDCGILDVCSSATIPAFSSLAVFKTGAADERYYEEKAWRDMKLRVTTDFAKTVELKGSLDRADQFLRPVNWILAIRNSNDPSNCELVIVTPFEANKLYENVKMSKHPVSLHLYSPRTSKSTCSFESLDFCTVSSASARRMGPLRIEKSIGLQLSLFSGELYYSDMEKYRSICDFLGLASTDKLPEHIPMETDGFVCKFWRDNSREATSEEFKKALFTSSPVGFLRVLVAMRRKGLSFDKSHLGRILSGDVLEQSDFFQARDGGFEEPPSGIKELETNKGGLEICTDVVILET